MVVCCPSDKESTIISIQVKILFMLEDICGLSQDAVCRIVNTTDILETVRKMYFTMHQEGDIANLLDVKEALHHRGVEIAVPPVSDRRWKSWFSRV